MTTYEEINSLEKFGIIAGTKFILNFQTFEEDGTTPLNLTSGSVAFRLTYLGQPDNSVVDKAGVIDTAASGLWHAVLETTDTEDLSGVFVQQPRVTDFGGDLYIPAQGEIVILPENKS